MKTREDFVSNSSSSSFIVFHKDNQYNILFGDVCEDFQRYDLKNYIERYGGSEFLGYNESYNLQMKFLSDDDFIRDFVNDGKKRLPECCKGLYKKLVQLNKQRIQLHNEFPDIKYDDERITSLLNKEDEIEKQILSKIVELLKDQYGDELFDVVTVSDHQCLDNNVDGCYSIEEQIQKRIEFARNRGIDIKFYRYINMH